jgi:hypothetical protein
LSTALMGKSGMGAGSTWVQLMVNSEYEGWVGMSL